MILRIQCHAGLVCFVLGVATFLGSLIRTDSSNCARAAEGSGSRDRYEAVDTNPTTNHAAGDSTTIERLREGTQISDQSGFFKVTGDRATFVSADGKHRFVGLENLNLERIVRTIKDDVDPLEWNVDGLITEYRGLNYLLITRATLKTKSSKLGSTLPLSEHPKHSGRDPAP